MCGLVAGRCGSHSVLLHAGYQVSGTHANPLGIKTDAPPDVLWDIMRCWVAQHPSKRPMDPESATGAALCAAAACQTCTLEGLNECAFSMRSTVHGLAGKRDSNLQRHTKRPWSSFQLVVRRVM